MRLCSSFLRSIASFLLPEAAKRNEGKQNGE